MNKVVERVKKPALDWDYLHDIRKNMEANKVLNESEAGKLRFYFDALRRGEKLELKQKSEFEEILVRISSMQSSAYRDFAKKLLKKLGSQAGKKIFV